MLKTMGIILRVLAVILLIGFIVGGVFAGKFVPWFRSGPATDFAQIMSLAVNWIAAAAVWLVGLCVSIITYGQGMILSQFGKQEER